MICFVEVLFVSGVSLLWRKRGSDQNERVRLP